MADISDTELWDDLIENDANQAPGIKTVALELPTAENPYYVYHCEPSHTVGEGDDTKISCPGCGNLCDMAVCLCGGDRVKHAAAYQTLVGDGIYHLFVPDGCGCRETTPLPRPEAPPVEECEWDLFGAVPPPRDTTATIDQTCRWCLRTESILDDSEARIDWYYRHRLGICTDQTV